MFKILSKLNIFLILLLSISNIYSGKGGAVAGAFFGGLFAGAVLNSASQPRYVEREVVYVPRKRVVYVPNDYYDDNNDAEDFEYDLGFDV